PGWRSARRLPPRSRIAAAAPPPVWARDPGGRRGSGGCRRAPRTRPARGRPEPAPPPRGGAGRCRNPVAGCRRWSARAWWLRLLHEREAGVEADLVVQQEAAARERCVPVDAVLDAVDRAFELQPDALVAPG